MSVPEIDLSDAAVLRDPFTVYGRIREQSPLARIPIPGIGAMWALTRHADARAMLSDPRFAMNSGSFLRPGVPEHCLRYMRTMSEREAPEHARLRRLVSPAFSKRQAEAFRPRVEPLVARLLDGLPADGPADLLERFARPLPMDVICELVGIPEQDRPRWREYGATIAAGSGQGFAEAVPGIMAGAEAAVARRRAEPGDDLLSELAAEPGLSDEDLVTLVWHLVMAGQTPTHLIANAVHALLAHPGQLAALRGHPGLMPGAVEEMIRWCGPVMMTIPRYATEDAELCGTPVRKGEPVTAIVASVNRDPRVFADPERFDVSRAPASHLGFAHGPHFCLGASLARVQTEVALAMLLERFPGLALAGEPERVPDPGTWRLAALPVTF
ncbi:cytochrome P450 family protein [Actinomadura macrotermitis]|uniref:Cytochrome P450 107B1 n=1 Tax=Actinomadura macrotermitis TaxID=2585200 RepID=A0A7K0BNN6_9ACTN|nr:Cytochrome P450 107B1 [Actinomadura macrotermitis]